jgi:rhomboid protease GluP
MLGALSPALLEASEWHRFFGMSLLHSGWLHLGFNVAALSMLGFLTESILGRVRFCLVFVVSIAASSVTSLVVGGPPAVGASGGIFGLIGAFLCLLEAYPDALSRGRMNRRLTLLAILVTEAAMAIAVPNIDWGAHLGGLLGGASLTAWMLHRSDFAARVPLPGRFTPWLTWILVAGFALSAVRMVQLDLRDDPDRVDAVVERLGLAP